MANRYNRVITDVDVRSNENNLAHRTREIDRERLIVRRGQSFSITLQCSKPLPPKHDLELVLNVGKKDRTLIKVHKEQGAGERWWFNHQGVQDEILLNLHSPANAIIGQYSLTVQLMSPESHIIEKTDKIKFHLLFNPWCKDDVVYLPDESLLQEYIMNENGVIYMGSKDYIRSLHWNYGQFENYIMDICFEILDNSSESLRNYQLDSEKRGDPVYIGRIISAMINSNDDRGVLTGRWQEPYTDGVSPTRWTGSVPILQKWSKAGTSAVKYGQCWVFAAVACTVLRCLGIPTRVITNFNSAHDVDGNLSLDVFYNERLERLDRGNRDSSWNFHCWVESWMRRSDLPKGNDGWQVLDPTPQELSEGKFCCGPCPVAAIKEGNLTVKYDAPFIFAEVNADIVEWVVRRDGQKQKARVDESSVGMYISTKGVWGDHREDVTQNYKYPEGSIKEREAYKKAGRRSPIPNNVTAEPNNLEMIIKHTKPVFGTDFDVIIEVRNDGVKDVQAQLTVLAVAMTYNSIHRGECKRQKVNLSLPARKVHREVLRLHYDDYVSCVSEHYLIGLKAFLEVPGENEPIMKTVNIPLSKPELLIQVPGKAMLFEQLTSTISFTNPLPVPLKGGVFTVEGAGLLSVAEVHVKEDIAPGQKVSVKLLFTPMKTGVRKLMVDFDSDRLKDVKGVATLVVRKRNPVIATCF
ncbi:protein-glutamine gamma-glutamyltransferase 2 [Periophthalmus magnuspinnatus]|uniref:protein-glutamine gamma-glutamyltransferase 2 n=1 Tax=Periophthalmus magnuspinnatus TaxID=409849 RepID=UPI00145B3A7E|nr:protein-glutamine gamma-glutamyltransferase 2 [Periophthalmus magnuspinnatus]